MTTPSARCPHVYATDDPDRWVLTFGDAGGGRQAIWYRPHPRSATTVLTIDLERLVAQAVATANFPVPVHTWPPAKLERFCVTQFATFERPERTQLEMPSLTLQPDHHGPSWRRWLGLHHQVAITNGRNRLSVARHLGAQCVPVEVPEAQGAMLKRLIGCRCRGVGVFKWPMAFASAQRLRHLPSGELAGAPAPAVIPASQSDFHVATRLFVERLSHFPYCSSI